MSPPPDGPRPDDPVPKIVYRRKPETTPSPSIEQAREAMRRDTVARGLPTPESDSPIPAARPRATAPAADAGASRSGLRWGLIAVNLAFCLFSLLALWHVAAARTWEESASWDLGPDLELALRGLGILQSLAAVAAAGFGIAALGLLTRSRLGWRAAILWAVVCSLTLVGALYGLPSLIALRHPSVGGRHERPPP